MNIDEIKLLYEYNCWADRRILATSAQVSPEQYAAPASFGDRSLRGIALHILNGERGWRLLCQGASEVDWEELSEADFPTPHSLKARWRPKNTRCGLTSAH